MIIKIENEPITSCSFLDSEALAEHDFYDFRDLGAEKCVLFSGRGSSHLNSDQPRQDNLASFHCSYGVQKEKSKLFCNKHKTSLFVHLSMVAVSDGVGSAPFSHEGSKMLCEEICKVFEERHGYAKKDRVQWLKVLVKVFSEHLKESTSRGYSDKFFKGMIDKAIRIAIKNINYQQVNLHDYAATLQVGILVTLQNAERVNIARHMYLYKVGDGSCFLYEKESSGEIKSQCWRGDPLISKDSLETGTHSFLNYEVADWVSCKLNPNNPILFIVATDGFNKVSNWLDFLHQDQNSLITDKSELLKRLKYLREEKLESDDLSVAINNMGDVCL